MLADHRSCCNQISSIVYSDNTRQPLPLWEALNEYKQVIEGMGLSKQKRKTPICYRTKRSGVTLDFGKTELSNLTRK